MGPVFMAKKAFRPGKSIEQPSEDYRNKLSSEEKDFLDKFNYEYHYGGVFKKDSMLKDDAAKEAVSNHVAYRKDALVIANNKGLTVEIPDGATTEVVDEDWEQEYSKNGYVGALKLIYDSATEDVKNCNLDIKITLSRFYTKMCRLRRVYKRDLNHKRKSNEAT